MYQVIDYYKPTTITDTNRHERGQLWWTCFPYMLKQPVVTRFWPHRKAEKLDLRRFDPCHEQSDERAHTSTDEFLAITKFKRRPVVIISTAGPPYQDRAWLGGEYYLVAPLRSLRDSLSGEYKANPEFVWGAITYRYNSVFYLPGSDTHHIRESVIHFDWMACFHSSWLLQPCLASLAPDAMVCLDEWLRYYVYGKVRKQFHDDLEDYREMVGKDPQIRTGVFGKSGR